MPKLSPSVILAIMNAITEKSISSHDIIPRSQLPSFTLFQMQGNIERFGLHAINVFQEHIEYSNKVKNMITLMIQRRYQTSQICLLAMTMYAMGIAEGQILTTILHNELLKAHFSDFYTVLVINPQTQKGHCFIIIGNHCCNEDDDFQTALSQCSEEVWIADPYLSYLGRAQDYVASNHDYFTQFKYQTIVLLEKAKPEHLKHIFQAELQSIEIVKEIKYNHDITPFYDKKLIPLAKSGYPCMGKTFTHKTALLQQLNQNGLEFFGLSQNCKVDAICEITNRIDQLKIDSLQKKINSGTYYHNHQGQKFFVIPEINCNLELAQAITRL